MSVMANREEDERYFVVATVHTVVAFLMSPDLLQTSDSC